VNVSGLFKAEINGAAVCTLDVSDGSRNGTIEEHISQSKHTGTGYFSWDIYGHYSNGHGYYQRITESENSSYSTDDDSASVILNITSDSNHIAWISSQAVVRD